jgi:hypothetical protein
MIDNIPQDVKKRIYECVLKDVEKQGVGDKEVRESILKDLIDQSKAYPQRVYIETPLCTSTQILIMKIKTIK